MIDYVILGLVLLVVGLIIYFKWIRKSEKASCHCYKAKSCGIKLEELRQLFNQHEA